MDVLMQYFSIVEMEACVFTHTGLDFIFCDSVFLRYVCDRQTVNK